MLFCDREKIDKFNPDINCVLKFLSHLFSCGIGYSGINTAKSAISSLVGVISNRDIGTHVLIKRFIRGIFIRKPSLPRYNVTWDVALVLKHLETVNSHSCSLRDLSKKLAMLLALTTGQRVQTLCAVDIRNMEMDMNYVKIRFGDLLKQSRPSFHLNELYIEAFKANYSLCVVGNILRYLEVTLPLRKGYSLFISTIKPYNSVSRNTLANWLKESLRESGINLDIFSPHSTRSASTSAVVSKVPIDTIMRTAGWKSSCTFRKHYKRLVTNDSSFSHEILSSV